MAAARNRPAQMQVLTDGCYLHSRCETCPFAECELETYWAPQGGPSAVVLGRMRQARSRRREGITAAAVAVEMGVSVQAVHRWCKALEKMEGSTAMRTYCTKCEKSVEMLKGHAEAYGATAGAVEVKGLGDCKHAVSFISSAAQWERYKVRAA